MPKKTTTLLAGAQVAAALKQAGEEGDGQLKTAKKSVEGGAVGVVHSPRTAKMLEDRAGKRKTAGGTKTQTFNGLGRPVATGADGGFLQVVQGESRTRSGKRKKRDCNWGPWTHVNWLRGSFLGEAEQLLDCGEGQPLYWKHADDGLMVVCLESCAAVDCEPTDQDLEDAQIDRKGWKPWCANKHWFAEGGNPSSGIGRSEQQCVWQDEKCQACDWHAAACTVPGDDGLSGDAEAAAQEAAV
ncbi:unnamed protein product [Amoebophrya sp. A120]|nr:unnamed protein product [Amoebophrya sp. A120]|eukprot:GSA120T00014426001.1